MVGQNRSSTASCGVKLPTPTLIAGYLIKALLVALTESMNYGVFKAGKD